MAKSPSQFEAQKASFNKVMSRKKIAKAVAVRSVNKLHQDGAFEMTLNELSREDFSMTMHEAYETVLTADEQNKIEPPLTNKNKNEFQKRLAGMAHVLAELSPTDTEKIVTDSGKA